MASLEEMISKFEKLNFNDILDDSVIETSEDLLNHNKMQLLSGQSVQGDTLGRYKWKEYADFKFEHSSQYHAPYGTYNFDLYGDFQDAMYVRPLLTQIEVGSKDSKTKRLESLAGGGGRVFGLSKEDLQDYARNKFMPVYQRRLRKQLGLI